jgi:hypothetical protein
VSLVNERRDLSGQAFYHPGIEAIIMGEHRTADLNNHSPHTAKEIFANLKALLPGSHMLSWVFKF